MNGMGDVLVYIRTVAAESDLEQRVEILMMMMMIVVVVFTDFVRLL